MPDEPDINAVGAQMDSHRAMQRAAMEMLQQDREFPQPERRVYSTAMKIDTATTSDGNAQVATPPPAQPPILMPARPNDTSKNYILSWKSGANTEAEWIEVNCE